MGFLMDFCSLNILSPASPNRAWGGDAKNKTMENARIKIVNKTGGKTAEVYMYGIIGAGLDIDANVVVAEIEQLRKQGCRNFRFYVNSEGGEVVQGCALFNYLDRTDIDVEWVIDGLAASMMAMLITNPRHKVTAARYAKLMYHRVQGSVYGNSAEVRSMAEMIDKFEQSLIEMMAKRMNEPVDQVRQEFFSDGLDHWMTAEEARKRGLVDSVIEGRNIAEPAADIKSAKAVFDFYNKQLSNIIKPSNMDRAKIASLLNKQEKDIETDEALVAAVEAQANENASLRNELNAEKKKTASLEGQVKAMNAAKVKQLVDNAIAAKKIGEDERETYTQLATNDFDMAEKILGKMQGVTSVVDQLQKPAVNEAEKGWTFDDYHKHGKLENLKKENPQRYSELFEAKFGHKPNL
jgi:ATP-dependent Clp endopeptidase proteolytic subunit ClpP